MGNCGSHCAAIYTINIGGGRSTKVSRGGFLNSPDHSPSGKKIAYINYSQIETINATGGGRSVVFKGIKGSLYSSRFPTRLTVRT